MIGSRWRGDLDVASGERLLAWAEVATADGDVRRIVGGTRDALYLPERLPWEQIATATWDKEAAALHVVEVGRFGQERAVHRLPLRAAERLLQLVRERVTASMALQRHVALGPDGGVRVLARRAPGGRGEVSWFVDYDTAIDPTDPVVVARVRQALEAARDELGH